MHQSSRNYLIGISAIALLIGSCDSNETTTQKTASQDVAAMQQHPENKPSSPPPKVEPIAIGMMANVRADRAVKVESVKILDRIVVANQFFKPIEGKGGKLIAVYLTLKNTGKESGDMAFSRFRLVDSQGRKYDEIDDWMSQSAWLKESGLESANAQLFPGGSSKTAKLFRVAEDTQEIKLIVNHREFKLPTISAGSTENYAGDRQLDRQSITSSAAYKTVRSKAEEIYNNPTAKSEHDRLCVMADSELLTGNDDAKKIAAFCLAIDAYIKKKMTQEITESVSSNTSSNESRISRNAALAKVKQYIKAKSQLFGQTLDKNLGAELLTGKIYRDKIDKQNPDCDNPDDCLSSIDWLTKYNAYYTYGVQRIDSIDSFESNGDTATIALTTTESRTLHQRGNKKRSGETSQSTFDLVYEDGTIKISDIRNR
jgi:hypothetical protein